MKITYKAFELELKYPFTIAKFSRTSTPLMLVEISAEGFIGFGEASMVPYLGENLASATAFLKKVDLSRFSHPFNMEEIIAYLDDLELGQPAIKADYAALKKALTTGHKATEVAATIIQEILNKH